MTRLPSLNRRLRRDCRLEIPLFGSDPRLRQGGAEVVEGEVAGGVGGVFVVVVVVVIVGGVGFGLVDLCVGGIGRERQDTESRWFGDEGWGGGAGVFGIGGGLGFGAAGVAGLGLGEGGCEGEVEEEEGEG